MANIRIGNRVVTLLVRIEKVNRCAHDWMQLAGHLECFYCGTTVTRASDEADRHA